MKRGGVRPTCAQSARDPLGVNRVRELTPVAADQIISLARRSALRPLAGSQGARRWQAQVLRAEPAQLTAPPLRPVRILPEAKPDDHFGRFAKLKTALDESLGHRKPPPLVHNQAIMPPDNRPSPTPRYPPDGRRHPRKRVASKAGTPAEKASSQATRRG
jgi:hypothetical protein